jgi:hypothetical protein
LLRAIGFTTALLLAQNLLGEAAAVPGWLRTTGIIVEWAGILLGILVWVHAVRRGEKPVSQSLILAQLSRTQRRRVANQIKGQEPVQPEDMTVVLAAARQAVALQRFALRLLPAYFLFALGNLMWTDWGFARVLYGITLILFIVAVPIALSKLRRTKDFLANAGPGASK